jgi:hypothetical protein
MQKPSSFPRKLNQLKVRKDSDRFDYEVIAHPGLPKNLYFPKRAGFPVLFFELFLKAKAAFVIGPISSYWIIPYEVSR